MQFIHKKWLLIIGAALLLIGGVWYLRAHTVLAPTESETETTEIPVQGGVVTVTGKPGQTYTVNEIPAGTPAPVAPNYKASIAYGANITAEEKVAINKKLADTQAILAKNSQDFDAWLQLGALHKMGDDYTGAATIWEYVSAVWSNSTSANNLGDLYMNFIKNYPKAEQNYKKVIALDPGNIDAYRNLFYLYRDLYKQGTGADKAIIDLGLKNNPGNSDLLALKAQLK